MNLLFTSAGRRGYLLDYFRDALEGCGEIHAANSDGLAPAFLHADKTVVTPIIHSPEYIEFLLSYCAENRIRAIVPLFDIDLPVLARAVGRFEKAGIALVASREEVAMIANDKMETSRFLHVIGVKGPWTCADLDAAHEAISSGEVSFPLIVKPRWGMGSIGMYIAEGAEELNILYRKAEREIGRSYLRHESAQTAGRTVLVQQALRGEEYNLDVVNDLEGRHIATLAKKKLAMRSGETDAAVTVEDPRLTALGARLGTVLRHVGNLDVDVFDDGGELQVIDLNARFGGGYPFSHIAGANVPRAIVAWLSGTEPDLGWFRVRPGVTGVKDISAVALGTHPGKAVFAPYRTCSL